MAEPIAWPEGELYSCTDPESLDAESPEEASEEILDQQLHPRMTAAEVVEAVRIPLTVTAYKRAVVPESQADAWADSLLETLEENWREEYGDQDGDATLAAKAPAVMREAVRKIVAATTPWRCEEAGKVELTADQVEAIARAEWPGWFEEEAAHG